MGVDVIPILLTASVIILAAAGFKWMLLQGMKASTFPSRENEGFDRWRIAQAKVYKVLVGGGALLTLGLGMGWSMVVHRAQLLAGRDVPPPTSLQEAGGSLAVVGVVAFVAVLVWAAVLGSHVERIEKELGVDWKA
jgi:hypothetical protein